MDDSYRFGEIVVSCEGYDYPDDPYVLKGSCGVRSLCHRHKLFVVNSCMDPVQLEYKLELTEKGRQRHNQGGSWFSSSNVDYSSKQGHER